MSFEEENGERLTLSKSLGRADIVNVLGVRVTAVLDRSEITTVKELLDVTYDTAKWIPNFGRAAWRKVLLQRLLVRHKLAVNPHVLDHEPDVAPKLNLPWNHKPAEIPYDHPVLVKKYKMGIPFMAIRTQDNELRVNVLHGDNDTGSGVYVCLSDLYGWLNVS